MRKSQPTKTHCHPRDEVSHLVLTQRWKRILLVGGEQGSVEPVNRDFRAERFPLVGQGLVQGFWIIQRGHTAGDQPADILLDAWKPRMTDHYADDHYRG